MESTKENKAIAVSVSSIVFILVVNGNYIPLLAEYSKTIFWVYDFIQWVIMPAFIITYIAKVHGIYPHHYGFTTSLFNLKTVVVGMIAALTFYPAFFIVTRIVWRFSGQPTDVFTYPSVFPEGIMGSIIWVYSAVTAGVIESIFFIGLPWLLIQKNNITSEAPFAVISSLVFASIHWEQGLHTMAGAFAFGIIACAWYFSLRTLWPIVIGHTLIDLIAFR